MIQACGAYTGLMDLATFFATAFHFTSTALCWSSLLHQQRDIIEANVEPAFFDTLKMTHC